MTGRTRIGCALAVALAVPVLGAASCGGGSGGRNADPSVSTADFSFKPLRLVVNRGQRVTWKNVGKTPHTVRGPGFFSTRAFDASESYSHRFARAGTFRYICTLHPTLMTGVVIVRNAS